MASSISPTSIFLNLTFSVWVNPVRNSSGALNPAGIILKSNPAAASGPEGLPPGHEPFRGGAWPGGSSGALFLTG